MSEETKTETSPAREEPPAEGTSKAAAPKGKGPSLLAERLAALAQMPTVPVYDTSGPANIARVIAAMGGKKTSQEFVDQAKEWWENAVSDDFLAASLACGTYTFDPELNKTLYERNKGFSYKFQQDHGMVLEAKRTDQHKAYQVIETSRLNVNHHKIFQNWQQTLAKLDKAFGKTAKALMLHWGTWAQIPSVQIYLAELYTLLDVARPINQQMLYSKVYYIGRSFQNALQITILRLRLCIIALRNVDVISEVFNPRVTTYVEVQQYYLRLENDKEWESALLTEEFVDELADKVKNGSDDERSMSLAIAAFLAFPIDPFCLTKTSEYRKSRAQDPAGWKRLQSGVAGVLHGLTVALTPKGTPVTQIVNLAKTDPGVQAYRIAHKKLKATIRSIKTALGGGPRGGADTRSATLAVKAYQEFVFDFSL